MASALTTTPTTDDGGSCQGDSHVPVWLPSILASVVLAAIGAAGLFTLTGVDAPGRTDDLASMATIALGGSGIIWVSSRLARIARLVAEARVQAVELVAIADALEEAKEARPMDLRDDYQASRALVAELVGLGAASAAEQLRRAMLRLETVVDAKFLTSLPTRDEAP